jgi:hypothetical protein
MGTSAAAPPWLAVVAISATPLLGSVKLFIAVLFFLAPLAMAATLHMLLKRLSDNRWLTVSSAVLYAISPVAISAINSGRLATVVILILLPLLVITASGWAEIEKFSWRRVFFASLIVAILAAFSPIIFLFGIALTGVAIYRDYLDSDQGLNTELFNDRLYRRITLVVTPLLLCAPWSFELILDPVRFLIDAGFLIPGGGPNLAILGNPGGPGSLPLAVLSPLSIILAISLFSSTRARRVAEFGFFSLLAAALLSAISITGNGTLVPNRIYPGTLMTITTVSAISAAVIMLDKLRDRLIVTNINFRHISAATLLVATILYALSSIGWIVTKGATSPLQTGKEIVLPAFSR